MHTIPDCDSERNTLPEKQCNSSKLSSSTAGQFRPLAQLLDDLETKPLYENITEIVQSAPPIEPLKDYAALDPRYSPRRRRSIEGVLPHPIRA